MNTPTDLSLGTLNGALDAITSGALNAYRANPPGDLVAFMAEVENIGASSIAAAQATPPMGDADTAEAFRNGASIATATLCRMLGALIAATREHLAAEADREAVRYALPDTGAMVRAAHAVGSLGDDETPPHGTPRPAILPVAGAEAQDGPTDPGIGTGENTGSWTAPDGCLVLALPKPGSRWYLFDNPALVVEVTAADRAEVRYHDARLNRAQRRELDAKQRAEYEAEKSQATVTFLAVAKAVN